MRWPAAVLLLSAGAVLPACLPKEALKPAVATAPDHDTLTPSPTPTPVEGKPITVPLAVKWKTEMRHLDLVAYAPIETAGPVVVDGVVYTATARGKAVYAMDARTGLVRWRFYPRARVEASPAVGGGRVYVATSKGEVFAVDQKDGHALWHADVGGVSTSRVVFDGTSDAVARVVVSTADNKVHCLDAKSGAELWVYRRDPPSDLTIWGSSSPVQAKVGGVDVYFAGFSDGTITALKAASGTALWETRLVSSGRFRDVDGSVAVDATHVYVSAYGEALHALDLETGRVLWSMPPGGASGVTLAGGKLFHGTESGDVLARDPADGRELWRWHMPAGVPTTPVISGEFVFLASSSKTLYALREATGELAWSYTPDYQVAGGWAAPVVVGHELFFVSNVGTVYSFEPSGARTHFIGSWDSSAHL